MYSWNGFNGFSPIIVKIFVSESRFKRGVFCLRKRKLKSLQIKRKNDMMYLR